MEIFRISQLNFSYPQCEEKALNDINFTIESGNFITLCGPSGCGKSTLLKHFKSVLKPIGNTKGEILFQGKNLDSCDEKMQTESIGFVSQSPDNQIVTDKVWHELAFGLESLGYNNESIRQRVAEMASFFGIQDWFYKNVYELSGGQKQILCLASIMTMLPNVIVLDEPTSQLDPIAASDFINMLIKINRELGVTVIISEHRLEEIIPVSDKLIVMDQGKIIANDLPTKVCVKLKEIGHPMIFSLPVPMRVWSSFEEIMGEECPLTINDGRKMLQNYGEKFDFNKVYIREEEKHIEKVIEINDIWFKYKKDEANILKGVSLEIYKGEFYGILGGNGTGKSTLLSVICRLNKPYRGKINIVNGKIIMLPQNPQTLFVKKTVLEDLMDVANKDEKEFDKIINICMLTQLLKRHPYDLSGGEQQRVAIAKILLLKPDIILLDEPTKGLDNAYKRQLGNILTQLSESGKTIIMVSHDVEFCAEYTNRCAMFFDGNIVSENTPNEFFSGNSFYTTAGNRMSRTIIDNAVTVENVISACSNAKKKVDENLITSIGLTENNLINDVELKKENITKEKSKVKKKNIIMTFMLLFLIPFTIYGGVYFFDDKKYLFISLVVLLECMSPFFILFEGRNPMARELVTISVLCGICVAGRMAFYMFPEFKPVVALVILTGVTMGAETGFLVGAVTMLVSNIMFEQGPWTPWQMFAMGIVGLFAGILFYKKEFGKNRIVLAIYGFFASTIIYGGIMNPAAAVMSHASINKETIISYYLTGIYVDIVRGIATIIFIVLLSRPIIEKIERVQKKYF